MKTGGKTGSNISFSNGILPPASGEGMYICRKCKKTFFSSRKGFLSEIFGGFFVRCPECGSFKVERSPFVLGV